MAVDSRPVERTELDPLTGSHRQSHLVAPIGGTSGHALALEARVLGLAVTALCGLVLTPSRDPRDYPTGDACLEVFRDTTGAVDGWRDA